MTALLLPQLHNLCCQRRTRLTCTPFATRKTAARSACRLDTVCSRAAHTREPRAHVLRRTEGGRVRRVREGGRAEARRGCFARRPSAGPRCCRRSCPARAPRNERTQGRDVSTLLETCYLASISDENLLLRIHPSPHRSFEHAWKANPSQDQCDISQLHPSTLPAPS